MKYRLVYINGAVMNVAVSNEVVSISLEGTQKITIHQLAYGAVLIQELRQEIEVCEIKDFPYYFEERQMLDGRIAVCMKSKDKDIVLNTGTVLTADAKESVLTVCGGMSLQEFYEFLVFLGVNFYDTSRAREGAKVQDIYRLEKILF